MKTIKVDITLTPYDLAPNQGPLVRFAKLNPDRPSIMLTEKMNPQMGAVDIEVENWEAIKIHTGLEIKYYLVKMNEKEVFNELLQISNDRLDMMKRDALNRGLEMGRRDGQLLERVRIKNTSWFKRLFNKF